MRSVYVLCFFRRDFAFFVVLILGFVFTFILVLAVLRFARRAPIHQNVFIVEIAAFFQFAVDRSDAVFFKQRWRRREL